MDSSVTSIVVLTLLGYAKIAEMSMLGNIKCQFLSPCDMIHMLRPLIDSMDAQITRMSQSERTALMKIYELLERVDILEQQLGIPYWSVKATKRPEVENESLVDFSGTSGTRLQSGTLLGRMANVEEWKQEMERSTIPGVNANMQEILTQIQHYDSVPSKLEVHNSLHSAAERKIRGLEQDIERLNGKVLSLESQTERSRTQFMDMINIQVEMDENLQELGNAVDGMNKSHDRFVDEQSLQIAMTEQSQVFDKKWKGFHDDLHVLIDDVMKLEDQQLDSKDQTQNQLLLVNERLDDIANTKNLSEKEIGELKRQLKNEVSVRVQLAEDVTTKEIVIGLQEEIDNVSTQMKDVEIRMKEEFYEELIQIRNIANVSVLPVSIRTDRLEAALKWREKQIRMNSVNIESLTARLEHFKTYLEKNISSTMETITEEISKIKHINSMTANPQVEDEMAGDAIAEFLILKPSCDFTMPDESSNIVASLDGRPLAARTSNQTISINNGHVITFRCREIGNFRFTGDGHWTCQDGGWQREGQNPECEQLLTVDQIESKQNIDMKKSIPSIQILPISSNDSFGITSSGELVALPGSDLILNCIYPKSFGFPQWSKTTHTKYFIPGRWMVTRNGQPRARSDYKYQILLTNLREDQSGIYTCDAGRGKYHFVNLIVSEVRCSLPPSADENLVMTATSENKMNSILNFKCKNPNDDLHWPRDSYHKQKAEVYCLPSGKWSSDFPSCVNTELIYK